MSSTDRKLIIKQGFYPACRAPRQNGVGRGDKYMRFKANFDFKFFSEVGGRDEFSLQIEGLMATRPHKARRGDNDLIKYYLTYLDRQSADFWTG